MTSIKTQGSGSALEYVKKFKMYYSDANDQNSFNVVEDFDGVAKVNPAIHVACIL